MFANTYEGDVETWKSQLLTRRARRLGFAGADLEDAQQEIILDIINFRFNPSRSNGATEATALTALIDRRLLTLRRSKHRYERHFEPAAGLADDDPQLADVDRCDDVRLLAMDVRRAMDEMPPQDRLVCEELAQGKTVAKIAKRRGCSWHTVGRQVANIRRRLATLGLDGWLSRGA